MVKKSKNKYVVVRTYSAGVHIGELISRNGKEVVLKNSRRLWYWEGAMSLSQVATDGVSENSKLAVPVSNIVLTEAIEIIQTSPKAEKLLKGFPIWKK